jgi:alpha-beta hydrolase superfamily lysophospholipase
MKTSHFTFRDHDGIDIFVYRWTPEEHSQAKAVIQIVHGMIEHGGRYAGAAEAFTRAGYKVYLADHPGHGRTYQNGQTKGQFGPRGWQGLVDNMRQLTELIVAENPNLPVFLLGHSMGSLLAQQYIQQGSGLLKGAILSGTNGKESAALLTVGRLIAGWEARKHGLNAHGDTAHKIIFGPNKKPFRPARTHYDWVSRDPGEVDEYVADPMCGFICPNSSYIALLTALSKLWNPASEAKISKDLPIYIYSGAEDPVGKSGIGVTLLFERYRRLGIRDVSMKLYPGGRHEMFREINREEVHKDVVQWLEAHLETLGNATRAAPTRRAAVPTTPRAPAPPSS